MKITTLKKESKVFNMGPSSWNNKIGGYSKFINRKGRLPRKLWKLLALAWYDMSYIKAKNYITTHKYKENKYKSMKYVFDMDHWYTPSYEGCYVCMAGAVLANTLKWHPHRQYVGSSGDSFKEDFIGLVVINQLRNKSFDEAYVTINELRGIADIDDDTATKLCECNRLAKWDMENPQDNLESIKKTALKLKEYNL